MSFNLVLPGRARAASVATVFVAITSWGISAGSAPAIPRVATIVLARPAAEVAARSPGMRPLADGVINPDAFAVKIAVYHGSFGLFSVLKIVVVNESKTTEKIKS